MAEIYWCLVGYGILEANVDRFSGSAETVWSCPLSYDSVHKPLFPLVVKQIGFCILSLLAEGPAPRHMYCYTDL